jgi:predicted Zn-dependent protease
MSGRHRPRTRNAIAFARGFRPPTEKAKVKAVASPSELSCYGAQNIKWSNIQHEYQPATYCLKTPPALISTPSSSSASRTSSSSLTAAAGSRLRAAATESVSDPSLDSIVLRRSTRLRSRKQTTASDTKQPSPKASALSCIPFFEPVPAPSHINDWLAQYVEPSQQYSEFLETTPWLDETYGRPLTRHHRGKKMAAATVAKNVPNPIPARYPGSKLLLIPIGEFPPGFLDLDALSDYVSCYYDGLDVQLTAPAKVYEKSPLGTRKRSSNRNEYLYWHLPLLRDEEPQWPSDDGKGTTQCNCNTTSRTSHAQVCPVHPLDASLVYRIKARTHIPDDECPLYHRQLQVQSCLDALQLWIPDSALMAVAITYEDLFDTSSDLFVAGMANGNAKVAVFSFHRYQPRLEFSGEFWYAIYRDVASRSKSGRGRSKSKTPKLPSKNDQRLVLQRCCRLLVHEIGHLLGIEHCVYFNCCMNGSGHLQEDFRQIMHLCPVDLRKIVAVTGCDVLHRYQGLLHYYSCHGMKDEASWVARRLSFIQRSDDKVLVESHVSRKRKHIDTGDESISNSNSNSNNDLGSLDTNADSDFDDKERTPKLHRLKRLRKQKQ